MSEFGYDNYNGGGFSNNSQGGFTADNQGSSQRAPAGQTRQKLTPVTIKQINDATQPVPDSEFKVHNVELNLVSFVGVVRKVENNGATVLITIEDGTGTVEVRRWVDEQNTSADEESQKFEEMLNPKVFLNQAKVSPMSSSHQEAVCLLMEIPPVITITVDPLRTKF
ncbi:Replication factor A protein 2, putative [Candida maltosa Xu316]|uniref:Replication factor A protein 2, putative n=1 Tax=Candida maltosa (strain Xu316) TaxID=1245528 RepID=M3J568_CANMX|nr:Replication factor A protein 2, putative [Candida maltosa Xu316]